VQKNLSGVLLPEATLGTTGMWGSNGMSSGSVERSCLIGSSGNEFEELTMSREVLAVVRKETIYLQLALSRTYVGENKRGGVSVGMPEERR
jgi:hypothetical protein